MDLKNYIEGAKELEVSLYKQRTWCQQLEYDISCLQRPKYIETAKKPEPPREIAENATLGGMIMFPFIGGGLGFSLFVLGFFADWLIPSFPWRISLGDIFSFVLFGAVAGLCLLVPFLFIFSNEDDKNHKEYLETCRQIDKQNFEIEQKNEIIREQSSKKIDLLKIELKNAEKMYNETSTVFAKYYSAGIIFGKYRSLVPICMFNEYLISGRCTSLEGPHGAYNLYEQELLAGIIINKLDVIINKLDKIIDNQYMLAEAIRSSHAQLFHIHESLQRSLNKLEDIKNNEQINAYYNSITANNTKCIANLQLYEAMLKK